MAKYKGSRPALLRVPVYASYGSDGWNLVVYRLQQQELVIGFSTLLEFAGRVSFPDGRSAKYRGQRQYDLEADAMADRAGMMARARRWLLEQEAVLVPAGSRRRGGV